jgi:hypothetical protein
MCYDHIAGRLGVAILDALIGARWLIPVSTGFEVTEDNWFGHLGIDVDALRAQRRTFARGCIDWTERRPHLAGALGAAVATSLLEQGWVERRSQRRGLRLTSTGSARLNKLLGIEFDDLPSSRPATDFPGR